MSGKDETLPPDWLEAMEDGTLYLKTRSGNFVESGITVESLPREHQLVMMTKEKKRITEKINETIKTTMNSMEQEVKETIAKQHAVVPPPAGEKKRKAPDDEKQEARPQHQDTAPARATMKKLQVKATGGY